MSHLSHLKRTLPSTLIFYFLFLKKKKEERSVASVTMCLKSMGYKPQSMAHNCNRIVTSLYNQALSVKRSVTMRWIRTFHGTKNELMRLPEQKKCDNMIKIKYLHHCSTAICLIFNQMLRRTCFDTV